MISLMKILEVERSELHLLENSIATILLFMYCVNSACGCVRILVYPFFSHACCCRFIWNKFDIFVGVAFVHRLMLNDIPLFVFS